MPNVRDAKHSGIHIDVSQVNVLYSNLLDEIETLLVEKVVCFNFRPHLDTLDPGWLPLPGPTEELIKSKSRESTIEGDKLTVSASSSALASRTSQ